MFFSKTVGPTKSYNIGTPKVGVALSGEVDDVMMTSLMLSQNMFVLFSKTEGPMNKSYNIGTPKLGIALQDRPIIVRGCVINISKIAKTPPTWPKIHVLWVKYHVFCYELYIQAPYGNVASN